MYLKYRFKKSTLGLLLITPLLILGFNNCSPAPKGQDSAAGSSGLSHCQGLTEQSPNTIDEATDLINQLPKPLTVSCFLASLKKPLQVYAVDNVFSAQPSAGPEDPRIFLFSGNLVISVVPKGPSSEVIEFSQLTSDGKSVKGEIAFPVTAQLPGDAPYSKIKDGSVGTACRICHGAESRDLSITRGEAFKSGIIEPDSYNRIGSTTLNRVALNCNSSENLERCRILNSIFVNGKGQDAEFPPYTP